MILTLFFLATIWQPHITRLEKPAGLNILVAFPPLCKVLPQHLPLSESALTVEACQRYFFQQPPAQTLSCKRPRIWPAALGQALGVVSLSADLLLPTLHLPRFSGCNNKLPPPRTPGLPAQTDDSTAYPAPYPQTLISPIKQAFPACFALTS